MTIGHYNEVVLLMRWALSEVSLYIEIGFALLIINNKLEVLHNHLVQTNVFV